MILFWWAFVPLVLLLSPTAFALMDSEQNYEQEVISVPEVPTPPPDQSLAKTTTDLCSSFIPYSPTQPFICLSSSPLALPDAKPPPSEDRSESLEPRNDVNLKESSAPLNEDKKEAKKMEEGNLKEEKEKEKTSKTEEETGSTEDEKMQRVENTLSKEEKKERKEEELRKKEEEMRKKEEEIKKKEEEMKKKEEEMKRKEEKIMQKEEEMRKKEEEEKKKIPQEGEKVVPNASLEPMRAKTEAELKNNFASPHCGARVVSAYPDAASASNIISANRDEYLLNKCEDRSWFVVELCESIKALKVELANLELFSSNPKEFRVSLSNAYPAREKDWVLFGQFSAANERQIQVFDSTKGVSGKFVKVEILSHHGSEYYCPISLFRIYGISEIELMGNADEDVVSNSLLSEDEQSEQIPSVQEIPNKEGNDTDSSSTLVNYIKEKVDETIGKVKDMFTAKEQSTVATSTTQLKNFASPHCSARVVSAYPEGSSASNVLSADRDEYMLTKCEDHSWFVVELCESIKAKKVELANLELFSSNPKEFRVTLSNVYPARKKDWALFGQFSAENERQIQAFNSAEGVLGKFVQVEILSHHGSEYYCPISLFRIYGIPEIEMMGHDDEDKDLESLLPEDEETVNVLDQEENEPDSVNSLIGSHSFIFNVSCPECSPEQFRHVHGLLSISYDELMYILMNPAIKSDLARKICASLGFDHFATTSSNSSAVLHQPRTLRMSPRMIFFQILFGTSRTIALCNVLAVENGLLEVAVGQTPRPKVEKEPQEPTPTDEVNESCDSDSEKSQADEELLPKVNESSTNTESKQLEIATEESTNGPGASHTESGLSQANGIPDQPIEETESPESSNSSLLSQSPTVSDDVLQEPPAVVEVTPSSASHISPSTTAATASSSSSQDTNGKGQASSTHSSSQTSRQESVWQKLTNKIKSLERNVTLSSSFLEDLSTRYQQQIEDLQASVKAITEANEKMNQQMERNRDDIQSVRKDLKTLDESVLEIKTTMNVYGVWGVGLLSVFIILQMAFGILFLFFWQKRVDVGPHNEQVKKAPRDPILPTQTQTSTANNSGVQDIQIQKEFSLTVTEKDHGKGDVNCHKTNLDPPGHSVPRSDLKIASSNLSRRHRRRPRTNHVTVTGKVETRENATELCQKNEEVENFPEYEAASTSSGEESAAHNSDCSERLSQSCAKRVSPPKYIASRRRPGKSKAPCSSSPLVKTTNMFGLLDRSVHESSSPTRVWCDSFSEMDGEESSESYRRRTTSKTLARTPEQKLQQQQKMRLLRSQSTSPQRIGEVAKQKEIFQKFNPEEVDWIKDKRL